MQSADTVAPADSQPLRVCQSGCFLESGSLLPPPAALRLFPLAGTATDLHKKTSLKFVGCNPQAPSHLPIHRRFASANRGASSKAARFFRHRRRFASFPLRGRQLKNSTASIILPRCNPQTPSHLPIPRRFASANRGVSSKAARFFRHWRHFASFP